MRSRVPKRTFEEARQYIGKQTEFDREFSRSLDILENVSQEGMQYVVNIPDAEFELKSLDRRIDDLIDYFLREYQYENAADERAIQNAGEEKFDPLTARFIFEE